MNKRYRISVVSYLNTIPFIYGLEKQQFLKKADISLDYPLKCAEKLINNQVDIGLIPVAVLPLVKNHKIVADYCIGSQGKVRSVILYSNSPLDKISSIMLDYQSGTSVRLVRILAKKYWKIKPQWLQAKKGYEDRPLQYGEAAVIIGDRSFRKSLDYSFVLDLSEEWVKYTVLPFVFATWTANKKIDEEFLKEFNEALSFGVANIAKAVKNIKPGGILNEKELYTYLTQNISYELDKDKLKGIELFLSDIKKLDI